MSNNNYHIETMTRDALLQAIDWAAEEGWNPGIRDLNTFYSADPNGFLMGYLDDEPIASLSVVKYDTHFGFLGFYIVKPAYRGKGYGLALWQAGLAYLKGCNIGLDGVVEQQPNYQKSGFQLAYNNIRFEGLGGGRPPSSSALVPLDRVPFNDIERYDRQCFPVARTAFLRKWLMQPGSIALGIQQRGQLAGYGVVRPCRNGFKIGPLFANDALQAEVLFLALKSHVPASRPVFLDVPEVNGAALALAEKYRMTPVFSTARMYTGDAPKIALDRIFGVTTFELG
ncbi:GNAT family N-acetyltransferase [Photobacterium japonica]|uniref:GNAT family N-acetyltransferase n=1 Tax=Photobacterium japonica TaxID=2910235 RepID=UPI003D0C9D7D